MFLFLVSRDDHVHYEEYFSFVCAAETQADALAMHPEQDSPDNPDGHDKEPGEYSGWTKNKDAISVMILGEAAPNIRPGVLHSSNKGS